MGVVTITQMADRVSSLMEERLGARGRTLQEKLRSAGRKLPRKVRNAAEGLAAAAEKAQNPKLLAQLDEELVAEAYDICIRHLGRIGRADRRMGVLVSLGARVAFSLLVVGAGVVGYLVWRGYV